MDQITNSLRHWRKYATSEQNTGREGRGKTFENKRKGAYIGGGGGNYIIQACMKIKGRYAEIKEVAEKMRQWIDMIRLLQHWSSE